MSAQLDLDRLLQVARAAGALSENGLPSMGGRATKETSLTLSTMPSLAPGCCGLFSLGGENDLLTLVLPDEPFLVWMGWKPNNECDQFVKMITYVSGAGTSGGTVSTPYAAACDNGNGVEFGTCEILLPDKGRLKRVGPVRDLTINNLKMWEGYPVYAKDGTQITDEIAWSTIMTGIAMQDDIKRSIFEANASSTNQFAGFESLINLGYRDVRSGRLCSAMDSIVLDWSSNTIAHEINGFDLIDYLIDIVRRIKTRAAWSKLGSIGYGDMVIVTTTQIATCMLDVFTCWSVCPGAEFNPTNLSTYEARQFRNSLNGGLFGMGQITIDGVPIPLLAYDWLTSTYTPGGAQVSDLYVMVRQIGATPILWGQYIDMRQPAARFSEVAEQHYKATDDGKFLSYWKTDNECIQNTVVFRPNIYIKAPWAQARIQNVACTRPLAPILPDPSKSGYPEHYLTPAVCPEDYLTPGLTGLSVRQWS